MSLLYFGFWVDFAKKKKISKTQYSDEWRITSKKIDVFGVNDRLKFCFFFLLMGQHN